MHLRRVCEYDWHTAMLLLKIMVIVYLKPSWRMVLMSTNESVVGLIWISRVIIIWNNYS